MYMTVRYIHTHPGCQRGLHPPLPTGTWSQMSDLALLPHPGQHHAPSQHPQKPVPSPEQSHRMGPICLGLLSSFCPLALCPSPSGRLPQTGGACCLRAPALAPSAPGALPGSPQQGAPDRPSQGAAPPPALPVPWPCFGFLLYCQLLPRGLESPSACSPQTPAPRTVPGTLARHEPVPTSPDHPSLQLASEHRPQGIPFWGHSWPPRGDWHLHKPPSPCPHLLCHSPASQSQFPRGDHSGRNIPLLPGHRPPANPV